MAHAVRKYLARWAEPEVSIAEAVERRYERALVVPAYREEPSLLDGYVTAARTSRGTTLCILVVNAPDDAPDEHHHGNARFFDAVLDRLDGVKAISHGERRAFLGALVPGKLDVLVIDRASPGARLPRKRGVGLARKIGADLAVALHGSGQVESRLVFATDADALLPEAHFEQPEADPSLSAIVFPFWHDAGPDDGVNRATGLYELSLRYYVAGLAFAGSPYAFHTLGSAMASTVEGYAAVRGVPRREAAEDFYLLNKLAKVGTVAAARSPAVRILSRASDRTPFGTGASVRGGERPFYAPECFSVLRTLLASLTAFAEHGSIPSLRADLDALGDASGTVTQGVLEEFGMSAALEAIGRETKQPAARLARVHGWFDGFRTLKLVHALRDRVFPSLPWEQAVRAAPFAPAVPSGSADAITAHRVAFAREEERKVAPR